MNTYGYVRASTKEQNEDRQITAMRELGVADSRIVLDKQSGKDFERPGCRWPIRKLKAGDTLVIKSIDRLGRNCEPVMAAWRRGELSGRAVAKELGVAHGTFQRWCKE